MGPPVCASIEGESYWSAIYSLISAQIDVVAILHFLREAIYVIWHRLYAAQPSDMSMWAKRALFIVQEAMNI